EPIDRRSDIFSLGVVLWEGLAMRRLFKHKSPLDMAEAILEQVIPPPSTYRSEVPPRLDRICMRALARDLGERYATAADLQEDLERFLSAAAFRPQKNIIAKYMQTTFAADIAEREALLRQVAAATAEIKLSLPQSTDDESLDAATRSDDRRSAEMSDDRDADDLADAVWMEPIADSAAGESDDSARSGPAPGMDDAIPTAASSPPPSGAEQPAGSGSDDAAAPTAGLAAAPVRPRHGAESSIESIYGSDARAEANGDPESSGTQKINTDMFAAVSLDELPAFAPAHQRRQRWFLLGALAFVVVIVIVALAMAGGDEAPPTAPKPVSAGPGSDEPDPAPEAPMPAMADMDSTADSPPATADQPPEERPDLQAEPHQAEAPQAEPHQADVDNRAELSASVPHEARRQRTPKRRENARALYDDGFDLFMQGEFAPARDKFRAALKARPGYARAHRGLGLVYERMGENKRAAKAYREYLRLAPKARDADNIRQRLAALGD
ncbi:MAG: tetratricopeptide repeat protein, partial [Myxococcota bacterium]